MSANHKIQKTTGGVVHTGSWMGNEANPRTSKYGYFTPSCGSGVVYAPATLRNNAAFRELAPEVEVTCKKCLKLAAKLAEAGTPEPQPKPETEAPAVYDHAAAVAQIRANREAEEEERAAARRARNRTNYAPAPTAQEDATITREPEDRTLTEVEEMEDQYQDLVHVGRGLRLLSDQFCRLLAEMKDGEGLDEDHPRFQRIKRKLDRNLKLEGENLTAREALSMKIREARKTGRCLQRGAERGGFSLQCLHLRGHSGDCKNSRGETFTNWLDPQDVKEKPFHRQVKDAIGLKW